MITLNNLLSKRTPCRKIRICASGIYVSPWLHCWIKYELAGLWRSGTLLGPAILAPGHSRPSLSHWLHVRFTWVLGSFGQWPASASPGNYSALTPILTMPTGPHSPECRVNDCGWTPQGLGLVYASGARRALWSRATLRRGVCPFPPRPPPPPLERGPSRPPKPPTAETTVDWVWWNLLLVWRA